MADRSRTAPILLLCVPRPELLNDRPAWGGGKMNATSVLLEPLAAADTELLLDNLLDGAELDGETRRRIVDGAQGNPLFVEEMVAMMREDGDVVVSPTIHALLQARLDRLGAQERSVIERAAVEGEIFHAAAVTELAREHVRADVPKHLLALVRKELIRPSEATVVGGDAFRFRHLLIRDTAYDSLPKRERAELHKRFARWMDEHASLVERYGGASPSPIAPIRGL